MSRPLRIEVAGGCYHVTARGVERRSIFRDDGDADRFVELLGQAATRFGFVVHAWVLMGNHYHLLLRTEQANLSRAMQWLNQQYAVGFNRRHRRVGTLLQGRFHAVVLDWEESGLAVSRYVHLNPVRVRRLGGSRRQREEGVNEPESGRRLSREQAQARLREHRWSSWQAYRGAQRAQAVAGFPYGYNAANQRTGATLADGSTLTWGYDPLGQVTSAQKKFGDGSNVGGQQFGYSFDGIGNRTSTTVNGRSANYTPNALNQYAQRTVPGAVDITGSAAPEASVTINASGVTRQSGGYFWKTLSVDNSTGAVDASIDVQGVINNANVAGQDALGAQSGRVFVPRTPEAMSYDFDGNLTGDGHWTYTWDAENRLVAMDALASVPATAKQRLEFTYDDQGRRIEKKTYTWNAGAYQ